MAHGKDPALPLYAMEWRTDMRVRMLDRGLRALLMDLWALSWTEGRLPDDPESLSRMVDGTADEVRDLLGRFFKRSGSGWISVRLEAEREERAELRRKRAEAGQAGGRKRRDKGGGAGGDDDGHDGRSKDSGQANGKQAGSKLEANGKQLGSNGQAKAKPSASASASGTPPPVFENGSGVTDPPPLEAIHSESVVVVENPLSLSGSERRPSSYASTSEPVHAGDILRGAFGGRAV